MAPFPPLQHPHERIKILGVKLAEFVVKHPHPHALRFTQKEALDAQLLLTYLTPYTVEVLAPVPQGVLSELQALSELQLHLDCNVVENLRKLLEGLISVCIPTRLDDVCKKALVLYYSAFAALTRITQQAAAQVTQPVALKVLDQLQPEDHKQPPGRRWGLRLSSINLMRSQCRFCQVQQCAGPAKQHLYVPSRCMKAYHTRP
jgi:hypothetical protein